jgi:predicted nucleic acid-binding Zn ribbon protein
MYEKKVRPLDGYLALAALMPFEEELPPRASAAQAVPKVAELWSAAAANKPELGLPVVGFSENDAEQRYEIFRSVRGVLRILVEVVTDPNVKPPEGRYESLFDLRMVDFSKYLPPPQRRSIMLTRSGVYIAEDSVGSFLRCLEQTGAEVWKLKSCPVCRAPFLPRREDQKACSPKCANTYRTRRSRARKATSRAPKRKAAVRSKGRRNRRTDR